MRCAWVQDRLVLYLAGELGPQETARLLRHLETCAACTTLAESLADTQEDMEAAMRTDLEAPPTLDARVMEAVRALPTPRRSWRVLVPQWDGRLRLALAGAALCLIVGGFFAGRMLRPAGGRVPTLDLAALSLPASEGPGISVSDPAQLSQQLTPQVEFAVPAVDLKAEGAPLVGGSRSTLQGVPVARLRYNWQGQPVWLYVMDDKKLTPPALPQVASNGSDSYLAGKNHGLIYVAWHTGKTNCLMVARTVPMHLLFRFACHACEKQERL